MTPDQIEEYNRYDFAEGKRESFLHPQEVLKRRIEGRLSSLESAKSVLNRRRAPVESEVIQCLGGSKF